MSKVVIVLVVSMTAVILIVTCVVIKAVMVVVSVPVNAAMVKPVVVVILSSNRLSEMDCEKDRSGGCGNELRRHVFKLFVNVSSKSFSRLPCGPRL